MKKKVGDYICQCGTNIAGKVDVQKIADEIGTEEGCVAVCRTYKYMCSEPGQKLIRDDIEELHLDHVVEASCTPKMHEPTFRNACAAAGMNPYMFEMVNIREHCSWVSEDADAATRKAKDLVRGGIEHLESRMDTLLYNIRIKAMLSARTKRDAEQLAGLLQVASSAEAISNAAGDIVNLLKHESDKRPFLPIVLKEAEEKIKSLTLAEKSDMVNPSIEEMGVESETGMRIIALKRGKRWIYDPEVNNR